MFESPIPFIMVPNVRVRPCNDCAFVYVMVCAINYQFVRLSIGLCSYESVCTCDQRYIDV